MMATVKAIVEEIEMESDSGRYIAGTGARCTRCDNTSEAFGTSPASVRACLLMLRQTCPRRQQNFYTSSTGEDRD